MKHYRFAMLGGELDNEGIKGYLPEKRRRITFGEGATRLHPEE
jgi:hypothetical protein